jgi:ribosomal protein S18 acetylase RimI-like enzyme
MENPLLTLLTEKDYDSVLALLEEAFPADERRDDASQLKTFNEQNYLCFVYKVNDIVNALITCWKLDGVNFIEHFAVDKSLRNNGIGSKILNELCKNIGGNICLEVEPPINDLKKRRIAFYTRNGFVINDYDYMQPAYSTAKNPVPLKIMSYGKALTKNDFEKAKNEIYKKVYKLENF